jgi:hypothetical protein
MIKLEYSGHGKCYSGSSYQNQIIKVESKSIIDKSTFRHSIFLEMAFVEDSLFHFKPKDNFDSQNR